MDSNILKNKIKKDYAQIVEINESQGADYQRSTVCMPIYAPIEKKYPNFNGYIDQANLGLGCGFPFLFADIKTGQTVVDLGCASGIDSFITSKLVGESGKVYGIDITQKLIDRANFIADKQKIINTSFICTDLENIQLPDRIADVILSNGVFSLITDLDKAFSEVYRLLKPEGIFCIADITKSKNFDLATYEKIKNFTGCLNGIRLKSTYMEKLIDIGFVELELVEERAVNLQPLGVEEGVNISTLKMRK